MQFTEPTRFRLPDIKISIGPEDFTRITDRIRDEAHIAIATAIGDLKETELITILRTSSLSAKDKILTYLHNTQYNVEHSTDGTAFVRVKNDYLRSSLRLSALTMKTVREDLAQTGVIDVWDNRGITIHFTRSADQSLISSAQG